MPLTLTVDTARWRKHHARVLDDFPAVVPVTKGNGYGFGNARLAAEAERLGIDLLAVGTYDELPAARAEFSGDILVLTPWRPGTEPPTDPRVLHTVSRAADLEQLLHADADARVVLELLTSMRRHGLSDAELTGLSHARKLGEVVSAFSGVHVEGWAMHLPLPAKGAPTHRAEVDGGLARLQSVGHDPATLFVSHLSARELADLRSAYPGRTVRARLGTSLWLGDRDAYRAHATVLDVHPVRRGDRFGYRQRRLPGNGHLVIVAGGTAHGVALSPPSHVGSLRERARAVAHGGLQAAGLALSPYVIGGRRRWFAEPPHMQVSPIFLPASVPPPEVGAEIDVQVGMTMTTFDRIIFE